MARVLAVLLTAALACSAASVASAEASAPKAEAQETPAGKRTRTPFPVPRTTETLTLDGAIAETLWEQALMLPLRYEVQRGRTRSAGPHRDARRL
jgi:hypothetical protein